MKARMPIVLAVLAAAVAALPAGATGGEAVRIEMVGQFTGPNTIEGTWTSTGAFADAGTYSETFEIVGDRIKGRKLLVGRAGTITLKAQGAIVWLSACTATFAGGGWKLSRGTGTYEGVTGNGQPVTTPDSVGDVCTGVVRIVHVGRARD
jgi:hypothetical protein